MTRPTAPIEKLSADKKEWAESMDFIYQEFGERGVEEILSTLRRVPLSTAFRRWIRHATEVA